VVGAGSGARVLVDRLWPRGLAKSRAELDDPERAEALQHLRELARQGLVTTVPRGVV
jgi:uncharacterized protein YeaO (DUF488 family)